MQSDGAGPDSARQGRGVEQNGGWHRGADAVMPRTPRALSIAGSDSGGGAGIQADLKAFARCGVHGMTAITAITAQSTVGVAAVHPVPPEIVLAQVRAVLEDIGVDAVKVGMLGTREVTFAVAQALDLLPAGTPVVVDPVMISESGSRLLDDDALEALIAEILPRASVLTPNLPEAIALAGHRRADSEPGDRGGGDGDRAGLAWANSNSPRPADPETLAHAVLALGPRAVVLTGGHREHVPDSSQTVDLLLRAGEGEHAIEIPGPRHLGGAAHGSGCTHSSALAARLALGDDLLEASRAARALAGEAVRDGLRDIGSGAGPVDVLGLRARRGMDPPDLPSTGSSGQSGGLP